MLPGRALTVIFSADNYANPHFSGPSGKGGVVSGVTILAHQRDVRAHGGELCAGGGNIVGGDVVSGLQTDCGRQMALRNVRDWKELDVRPPKHLYPLRIF